MADPNLNTAQPNQAQTPLTLTGGNDATSRYMDYYNQIVAQLGQNQSPTLITAPTIEMPREMQAQQIAAPEKIQADRINVDRLNIGEVANELDKYFQPYLQNSMRNIRANTARMRAQADANAYSRGMGGSTHLDDEKLMLAKSEASDLANAMSEYYNQLGQRALSAWDANENRWLTAEQQNARLAYEAAAQNAAYEDAVSRFNASALMQTDQYNIDNLIDIAKLNAQYAQNTDMFNAEAMNNWQQYLQQLAWGWAGQMYNTNPVVSTVYQQDPSGVKSNLTWEEKLKAKADALAEAGYTDGSSVTFDPAKYAKEIAKKYWMGGSKDNNFARIP